MAHANIQVRGLSDRDEMCYDFIGEIDKKGTVEHHLEYTIYFHPNNKINQYFLQETIKMLQRWQGMRYFYGCPFSLSILLRD